MSPIHKNFDLAMSSDYSPILRPQNISCWIRAISAELEALHSNITWSITSLPARKVLIGFKWVFKNKYKANGSIEHHKVCLVVKGYSQIKGVDFLDTFNLVAMLTTVRLVLAVTSSQNWHLQQLDINNAFLHGDLDEEVYRNPPPNLHFSSLIKFCRSYQVYLWS